MIDLPPDIEVAYKASEYQITALPIFAFTLYADKDSNNNLAVEAASLQFSTDELISHESAKAFVEKFILQFDKGKWKWFIQGLCPAVSGRSSFLNEDGEVDQIWNCPLDSKYQMSMSDWV